MVRHETGEIAVIVMLTPTEESGREKCFQYFPLDAESSPMTIHASGHEDDTVEGELSVAEILPTSSSNTTIRKLHLRFGEETKVVWHLLFTAFPDFGVPEDEDRAELLDLIRISAEKNPDPKNPRIIHCSAGVGRSGTFIALEYLLARLQSGAVAEADDGEDMVQDVVHRLREQRMMMVQMDTQYQFLYDVLREEFEKKLAIEMASSGQPSPKMRKLASGIKASTLHEGSSIGAAAVVGGEKAEEKDNGETIAEGRKGLEEPRVAYPETEPAQEQQEKDEGQTGPDESVQGEPDES